MIRLILLGFVLILFGAPLPSVHAHALEPGYLELEPLGAENWRVTWRKPAVSGQPMPIEAVLPENCAHQRAHSTKFDGYAYISRWTTKCVGGLTSNKITIDGLENTKTDVLVRYTLESGTAQTMRLTARAPSFVVPDAPSALGVLTSYVALGVEHILGGIDHLVFVFALLLLIRSWRPLIAAVTAFTVGHSISLAAATLGWIALPAPPVEAVIALSIMFLAAELVQQSKDHQTLTVRFPWAVAFVFGLLHGLGFAGALVEIGLPEGDIPLALFSFNVGVEIGQLMFIAVVLSVGYLLLRLVPKLARKSMQPHSVALISMGYGIGCVAAFWFVQRLALF
ncbi:HupE/UreJ family protein (plasmid) [Falsihalocynthiibacter sp. SS001]|uniref:HupE/UreJ family protein n=1 Tax=Falsihalocynthiibacter sp. SS001 TaxID=3349698 RepID=UPI0036D2F834